MAIKRDHNIGHVTLTANVRVLFDFSLWQAIKCRIAGQHVTELMKNIMSRYGIEDGEVKGR